MDSLSKSLSMRALPHLAAHISKPKGLRTWLLKGTYQISRSSADATDTTIVLSNILSDEIIPFLLFDIERFALSSQESFLNACGPRLKPNALGWPFVQLYYSAFYAAHTLMRVLGSGVIRLEAKQTETINELGSVYIGSSFNISKGTYYFNFIEATPKTYNLELKRLNEGNGAHETFWSTFKTFLNNVNEDILLKKDIDAGPSMNKLFGLESYLSADGLSNGSWLSSIRNKISYQHEFDIWFPPTNMQGIKLQLDRILSFNLDQIRFDFDTRSTPLQAFASAASFIAKLNFEFCNNLAGQGKTNGTLPQKWRRICADLKPKKLK